jgi:hypothetical protein
MPTGKREACHRSETNPLGLRDKADGAITQPCHRRPCESSAQLDSGRQLSLLIKHRTDRGGISLGNDGLSGAVLIGASPICGL